MYIYIGKYIIYLLSYNLSWHKVRINTKDFDVLYSSNVRSADRCYELTILHERGSLLARGGMRVLEKYHRIMNIHADESRDQSERWRGVEESRVVKLPRGESRIGRHILYDIFRLAALSADRSKYRIPLYILAASKLVRKLAIDETTLRQLSKYQLDSLCLRHARARYSPN